LLGGGAGWTGACEYPRPSPATALLGRGICCPAWFARSYSARFARHDNDLAAIYEVVTGHSGVSPRSRRSRRSTDRLLAEHGAKLTKGNSKLDQLTSTVAEQGSKLDELLALIRKGSVSSPLLKVYPYHQLVDLMTTKPREVHRC
jgi:hypothetical protein